MTQTERSARKTSAAKKTPKAVPGFCAAATAAGLYPHVGKAAVKGEYRSSIGHGVAAELTGSVDMDSVFESTEPNAARWDFGLGVRKDGKEMAFWVEAHPASSTGEVPRMLQKLDWLKTKLSEPAFAKMCALTSQAQASGMAFRWLARTGDIRIRPGSREANLLAQRGLAFPKRHVLLP